MVDNKFRYEYQTLKSLGDAIKRFPVVIQPIGIPEWHGPQTAVGMDGLASQRICERVIERLGDGLLMPTCWIGTYGYIHYPGSVCVDGETAYRVYKNLFREFIKLGFRLILLVSGHGGKWQVRALERARADALAEMKAAIAAPVELLGFVYPQMAPGLSGNLGHAGPVETSILWRIGQEYGVKLVDEKEMPVGKISIKKYKLPDDDAIDFPRNEEPEKWAWGPEMRDPAACSPEVGEKTLKTVEDGIYEEIQSYRDELGF
ncbi:MAG: creatininase family protein [Candidatus Lokiarchaeota archaeon]|nr:creatininase family protein [Candidatus Lokiarchaeota archaeon]